MSSSENQPSPIRPKSRPTLPNHATARQTRVGVVLRLGSLALVVSCGGGDSPAPVGPLAPAVSSVIIVAPSTAIELNATMQLTATLKDASGNTLSGRTVQWSSSDAAIASVSSAGLVTGMAVGGPATITATSEGKTGIAQVSVSAPTNSVATGIRDPIAFVSQCPTNDPAYNTIRQDFELRGNGQLITIAPTCTEPYSTTPIDQLTDELLAMQTLRMVYYMSQGTAGKLPWTPLSLYEWMKSEIAGIDFQTQQGLSACCEIINGKKYILTSRKDAANRNAYRDWIGVSNWLALFAHEARHADGPGHVNGCPAFPLPTDPAGCDVTYDPAHISSYGIQYWLFTAWATGYLNVGIGCTPAATAQSYATSAASAANAYLASFVNNPPPLVSATVPYGGHCLSP
jgi:Bacterial Ig-like domain (group 2)